MITKAFRRSAIILWKKFQKEFPNIDEKRLIDVYEQYFIKKKKQGLIHADYYLDFVKEIKR